MIDLEQIRAAEDRYARRDREGESQMASAERTAKRIARVAAAEAFLAGGPTAAMTEAPPADSADTGRVALERVLGRNDLMSILYLERGVIAARTVCRITIRTSATGAPAGFGTGSLVSPRLLLTNNHVLRSAAVARFSVAEFEFQESLATAAPQSRFFQLDPDAFFLTDPALDYTLVAVRDPQQLLAPYGWNQLVAEEGKVRKGEAVTIIQHPKAETKQIALRENEIIDILESFLLYRTDTAPGSSGSPVFNDQWELVGLHHAGVPRRKNGRIVTRSGQPWDDSMNEDLIDWIANEGARISRIIRHLKNAALTTEQSRLRAQCFEAELPRAASGDATRAGERAARGAANPVVCDGVATWTIPLQVSVRLGDAGAQAPAQIAAPPPPPPAPPPDEPDSDELRRALDALREAQSRPYYDTNADGALRDAFYEDFELPGDPGDAYDALHDLLTRKHETQPRYKPAIEVYPWVDLHPNLKIRSIYSGQQFDAEELIREDFRLEAMVEAMRTSGQSEESVALLEASLPFNCEHVVPQSWFAKREPMRGDLHHLFACESACNSFRGNIAYFDFDEVEEAFRDKCGRSEKSENKFEPVEGKGAVARATLYFLVRYQGLINRPGEYDEERIEILKRWHDEFPPGRYEKHRNWAICERQGNRNPFIDFPEWVEAVDFTRALG